MSSDADGERGPRDGLSDERLDSWKEIAAYLGRGVTTVQRWETTEGLPIQRLPHAKKGSVFAFKRELDAWRTARAQMAARPAASGAAPPGTPLPDSRWSHAFGTRVIWIGSSLAGFLLLALSAVLAVERPWRPAIAPSPAALPVPRPLANDSEREASPSVSPDGKLVVYSWNRGREPGPYINPVAGGQPRRLALDDPTKFAAADYSQWSPRGDLIAFLLLERPDVRGMYVVPAAGGAPRYLTSIAGIGLCWKPDGRSVVFNDRSPS